MGYVNLVVNTLDSKSSSFGSVGSIPTSSTKAPTIVGAFFYLDFFFPSIKISLQNLTLSFL